MQWALGYAMFRDTYKYCLGQVLSLVEVMFCVLAYRGGAKITLSWFSLIYREGEREKVINYRTNTSWFIYIGAKLKGKKVPMAEREWLGLQVLVVYE